MDYKIKKLNKSDLPEFLQLINVFEEVFEMKHFVMPPEEYVQDVLADDKFMVFVALNGDMEVIGGLTAYILPQYYSAKPLAYIFDLAVSTRLQRKGIGKALVTAINNYCRAAGMEEVFVQADKYDRHAIDFYRKNLPTNEEDVSHFYFTL